MKIGVFLSFCWEDQPLMDRIKNKLDKSLFLRPIVVTEKKRAAPAIANTKKVSDGIIQSKYFIPILTENSFKNQWVNQEIGYASAKERVIYPLVQNSLLIGNKLKGWIHREMDLPFRFDVNGEINQDNKKYREAYSDLLVHIEKESTPLVFSKQTNQQKRALAAGKIVYVDNQSRHLLLNGYIHPLGSNLVYNELKKLKKDKTDMHLSEDVFFSYPFDRRID